MDRYWVILEVLIIALLILGCCGAVSNPSGNIPTHGGQNSGSSINTPTGNANSTPPQQTPSGGNQPSQQAGQTQPSSKNYTCLGGTAVTDLSQCPECPHLKVPSTVVPENGTSQSNFVGYYISEKSMKSVDLDGWKWDGFELDCRFGEEKGENVNSLYCSPMYSWLPISKTFADDKGNVIGKVDYDMIWVYSPTGNGYKLTEIKYTPTFYSSNITVGCTVNYSLG